MKYRKDIVLNNLAIAFPEKSFEERLSIAKKFYLNFTDSFIESLKMISISKKELLRRNQCDNELLNSLVDKGKSVHFMAGHQFNWEIANLVYSIILKIQFVAVYMPVRNKVIDRICYKFRSRFGTNLISAWEFKNKMHTIFSRQYILVLAADQNPGAPANAYWMNFFSKPAPFVTGPAKGAIKNNAAVVFIGFEKIKRGYYQFKVTSITEEAASHTPKELTLMYKNVLEETIRQNPSNYLWSHRRWRHEWKEGYPEILK